MHWELNAIDNAAVTVMTLPERVLIIGSHLLAWGKLS